MRKITVLVLAAAAAMLAGCVTEGTPSLTHAQASMTQASQLNYQLGVEHMRAGRRADAVIKFEKAIEQDPKNALAHLGLAMINDQVGDQKAARTHYEHAMDVGGDDPVVQNAYAAWLCKVGRHADAEAQFLAAAKNLRYQTPEVALANAGVCARRGDNQARAEEHLRAALKQNPNYSLALVELADMYFARGEPLRSRAFLQRLMENSRPDARALLLAVRTEQALKDARAAQRFADQLKRDFPDSEQSRELDRK